jgi:hypothetical protein
VFGDDLPFEVELVSPAHTSLAARFNASFYNFSGSLGCS